MRKWFLFLAILGLVYMLSKVTKGGENRSPSRQRLSETISILVWALIIVYVLSFFYWLYMQIFR